METANVTRPRGVLWIPPWHVVGMAMLLCVLLVPLAVKGSVRWGLLAPELEATVSQFTVVLAPILVAGLLAPRWKLQVACAVSVVAFLFPLVQMMIPLFTLLAAEA